MLSAQFDSLMVKTIPLTTTHFPDFYYFISLLLLLCKCTVPLRLNDPLGGPLSWGEVVYLEILSTNVFWCWKVIFKILASVQNPDAII